MMGVIIVIIVLVRFWCSKWPTSIHITWLWCQDVSNCCLVKKGQQIRATPERIFLSRKVFLYRLSSWYGRASWGCGSCCCLRNRLSLRLPWSLLPYIHLDLLPPAHLPSSPDPCCTFPSPAPGSHFPCIVSDQPHWLMAFPLITSHSSLLSQKMSKYVQSLVHNIFSYKSKCSNSYIRI